MNATENRSARQLPWFVIVSHLLAASGLAFTGADSVRAAAQQDSLAARVSFQLTPLAEGEKPNAFLITGLTADELQSISAENLSTEEFQATFAVAVKTEAVSQLAPALAGKYEVRKDGVAFIPRYAPMRGTSYELRLDPIGLPAAIRPKDVRPIVREISLPKLETEPTVVTDVFPSGDELPENLLKFYLHFSAPMSVGDSYQHVKLFELSENGPPREIIYPFLTLEQELWDHEGLRFTLLFDPGRIKRGLKPREELGPALEDGKTYEFVINSTWQDANGIPLAKELRKRFQVLPPDDVQPQPDAWQINPPAAGSKDPLTVQVGEPLDHAMLQRVLKVVGEDGIEILGEVTIQKGETVWEFTPQKAWAAGEYELVIETTLEDRSGNSIANPFEVDVFNRVERGTPREFVRRKFTIGE